MSENFNGPKAPKDPTKKKPGFFIMRNKGISSSPTDDGKGVVYIYESDGRLKSSAKIIGNITDESMLDLLDTTEGFKKLVHSIGVTIECDDKDETVRFVFQMYGKIDAYGGGTNIISDVKADGMEKVTELSSISWREDDDVTGQIRFEFERPSTKATVSVKLYLNDGYEAPEVEDEFTVDFSSKEYQEMIAKSVMQTGNNHRLKKALEKARSGEEVTFAFIGGSITQGAGAVPINTECYARKMFEGFCDKAGRTYDSNVKYIKAGVGGTPSELGILRYDEDILKEGTPDIVIVEFAVNDEGDETKGEFYDSLVRRIYHGDQKPAVVLLFSVFADDGNLQERLKCVGESYNLPMVSVKDAVVDQFYKKTGDGRVVTKSQFFYDMFHPTNVGHRIMADGFLKLLDIVDGMEQDQDIESLEGIKPPKGSNFENVIRIDRKVNASLIKLDEGSFTSVNDELQKVERNMDLFTTPQFPDNYMYNPKDNNGEFKPLSIDAEFKIFMMVFLDSADNKVGKAEVFVDGEKTYYADPKVVGWTHCNAAIVYRSNESKKHHIEIKMADGSLDKEFTILGFGIVK